MEEIESDPEDQEEEGLDEDFGLLSLFYEKSIRFPIPLLAGVLLV